MMAPAIRYEAARALLDAAFDHMAKIVVVPAETAAGMVAAETVKSPLNLPETTNAAVDGYAVKSAILQANPDHPFTIIGEAKAGHPFTGKIGDFDALRIFTGAILPDEFDAVMMQEFCHVTDEKVVFSKAMTAGKNARPAGENLALDEEIIAKGTIIAPSHLAQLAAAGLTDIAVMQPLRIAIISTGDELVEAGVSAGEKAFGQIYDSNRPLLQSLVHQAGHQPIDYGIVPDDKAHLSATLAEAVRDCDMVITSGGAADGDEDHSLAALQANKADILFRQVAIKPGRPVCGAKINNKPVICLPGNPVAVYVCFLLFIAPVMQKLASGVFPLLRTIILPADISHKKAENERAEFVRVKLALTNQGDTVIVPHGRKGAGVLSSLTGADGLAELPFEAGEITPNMKLSFIPFR